MVQALWGPLGGLVAVQEALVALGARGALGALGSEVKLLQTNKSLEANSGGPLRAPSTRVSSDSRSILNIGLVSITS